MIDRRNVLAGVGLSILGAAANAAPDAALFKSGALARNSLAQSFRATPASLSLPDIPLVGEKGPQALSQLRGRTYLVSLWAEWCTPCLAEVGDLASLGQTYGGSSFAVIFVLTGSHQRLSFPSARALLAQHGAKDAQLLVESEGRQDVMRTLATEQFGAEMRRLTKMDSGVSLPCNLLVDRRGQIRGRAFGAPGFVGSDHPPGHELTAADKVKLLTRGTRWATSDGRQFAAALAAGALEKA
jgi:thiol-disulfide isomerase/thioredoxin